ncbi:MAG: aminotransferase class V-fold PLP-dependent enzyme [Vicinamibacteria bacterium]|nr:aminotransferase class V-fold PLP-dependent enzyme [Vicinamibacteria bacterium]
MSRASRREALLALSGGAATALAPSRSTEAAASPGSRDWSRIRDRFAIEPGLSYLNTGTFGPPLLETLEIEAKDRLAMSRNYPVHFVDHYMTKRLPDLVGQLAAFIGASFDEVAFTTGSTESMSYIANGLDLRDGDEILATTHEHSAGAYPWILAGKRRGCRLKLATLKTPVRRTQDVIDTVAAAITPRTRALSFCHINYTDGYVMPVKELVALGRSRGLITVVDGAQAIGMLDVNLRDIGCDFYAGSLHKWLGCPYGTGLLYVREGMREQLWPSVVESYDGWDDTDFYGRKAQGPGANFVDLWPKALLKYSSNFHYFGPLFWTLPAAIGFQLEIGKKGIESRIRELGRYARAELSKIDKIQVVTPEDPASYAGLISFEIGGGNTFQFSRSMRVEHGVVVRNVTHLPIGFDVVRASTHVFNTEEDVNRLAAAIRKKLA